MGAQEEIRAAIDAYYQANLQGLTRERFWVQDERVIAMHPQGGRLTGWKQVGPTEQSWTHKRAKWEYKNAEICDMAIQVAGDVAWAVFMVNVELHVPGRAFLPMHVRVSNIYEKHGSEWLLVLHHDSITDLDVLHGLQALQ